MSDLIIKKIRAGRRSSTVMASAVSEKENSAINNSNVKKCSVSNPCSALTSHLLQLEGGGCTYMADYPSPLVFYQIHVYTGASAVLSWYPLQ